MLLDTKLQLIYYNDTTYNKTIDTLVIHLFIYK